jgi:hypothetical protein
VSDTSAEHENESRASTAAATGAPAGIDPSALPPLSLSAGKGWGRRIEPRRWYLFGCGAGVVVLVVLIVMGYLGLRRTVWRSFDDMRAAVERCVIVDVPAAQRERLVGNLGRFQHAVESSRDPYPAIGRFMNLARASVADWAVDATETDRLNEMLENELATMGGGGGTE